jgi:hypothetical protein
MYVVSSWNTLKSLIYTHAHVRHRVLFTYMSFVEVDLELLLVVREDLHALAEELDLLAVLDLKTHYQYYISRNFF